MVKDKEIVKIDVNKVDWDNEFNEGDVDYNKSIKEYVFDNVDREYTVDGKNMAGQWMLKEGIFGEVEVGFYENELIVVK